MTWRCYGFCSNLKFSPGLFNIMYSVSQWYFYSTKSVDNEFQDRFLSTVWVRPTDLLKLFSCKMFSHLFRFPFSRFPLLRGVPIVVGSSLGKGWDPVLPFPTLFNDLRSYSSLVVYLRYRKPSSYVGWVVVGPSFLRFLINETGVRRRYTRTGWLPR